MQHMSGFDYFKRCLTQRYADFSGRSRRAEYWNFVLYQFLLLLPVLLLVGIGAAMESDFIVGLAGVVYFVVALGLVIPGLAAAVRRLHDTGRSGWWYLIGIIPVVGSIVILVFLVSDSEPHTNKWGPNPKNPADDVIDHFGEKTY